MKLSERDSECHNVIIYNDKDDIKLGKPTFYLSCQMSFKTADQTEWLSPNPNSNPNPTINPQP